MIQPAEGSDPRSIGTSTNTTPSCGGKKMSVHLWPRPSHNLIIGDLSTNVDISQGISVSIVATDNTIAKVT